MKSYDQLVANPSKFKLMFLDMDEIKLALFIDTNLVTPVKSVKLLGVTIDSELRLDLNINNICRQANKKAWCLYRIRKFLDKTQARRLCDAFVLSNFNYCPLIIWMYCNKTLNVKINRVHKRALRAVTGAYDISLDELLSNDRELTIPSKNLQALLTQIYIDVYLALIHIL